MQDYQEILAIVGVILAAVGGINAFFLRGIFKDLNDVKIAFATMSATSKTNRDDIGKLEKKLDDFIKEMFEITKRNGSNIHDLRNQMQTKLIKLEMNLKQIYEYDLFKKDK